MMSFDGKARSHERRGCNAKRRIVETGHVQRTAAVARGRSDIHGSGVNTLVGSLPVLKYQSFLFPPGETEGG